MKRLIVVFDNAPDAPQPWMQKVCAAAKLKLIDNAAVQKELGKLPEVRRTLTARPEDYQAALEKVAGSADRIALHSSNWLGYLPKVDGFVFDVGPSERLRKNPPPAPPKYQALVNAVGTAVQTVRDQAAGKLPKERILEFAPEVAEAKKAELAQTFVAKLS